MVDDLDDWWLDHNNNNSQSRHDSDELKVPLLLGNHITEQTSLVSPLFGPIMAKGSDFPPDEDGALPDGFLGAGAAAAATMLTTDEPDALVRDDSDNDLTASTRSHHQVLAMVSNFSTSYNVVNISLVLPILQMANSGANNDNNIDQEDPVAAVASSLLAGMMLGQLVGGWMGDVLGHARALWCMLAVQVVASWGSALLPVPHHHHHHYYYWYLAAWRFVLGVGAGGVYPLAATLSAMATNHTTGATTTTTSSTPTDRATPPLPPPPLPQQRINNSNHSKTQSSYLPLSHHTTEQDENVEPELDHTLDTAVIPAMNDNVNTKIQSLHRVVLTFSTQGLGFFAVPLVAVPLLYLLPHHLQLVARILMALGSVPGLCLLIAAYQRQSRQAQQDRRQEAVEPSIMHHRWSSQHGVIAPPDYCSSDDDIDNFDRSRGESDEENESVLDSLPDPPNADSLWTRIIPPQQEQEQPQPLSSTVRSYAAAAAHDDDGVAVASSPASLLPPLRHGWWDTVRHEPDLGRKLLGTAVTWFLFDVLFYGNALFQAVVVQAAFGTHHRDDQSMNPDVHLLQRTAVGSLWLTSMALPGYAVAFLVLGRSQQQTPRWVMLQGFAVMAVLYLILGCGWNNLRERSPTLLLILYGLTFFFANYGPNTTTFVLPSLVYSPACRSTLNGVCAAAGKLGAWLGASLFKPAADAWGDAAVLQICAAIALVAVGVTHRYVPSPDGYYSESLALDNNPVVHPPHEDRASSPTSMCDKHVSNAEPSSLAGSAAVDQSTSTIV